MFMARSRLRRQRFQQSQSLSVSAATDEYVIDPTLPNVTAKRGTFKHFAQSLARFQSVRNRRQALTGDPLAAGTPTIPGNRPPVTRRMPSTPSKDKEEKTVTEDVTFLGYPVIYFQVALIVIVCVVASVIIFFPTNRKLRYITTSGQTASGWRSPDEDTINDLGSDLCSIDRRYSYQLSEEVFEREYRLQKPIIITFQDGAAAWTDPDYWMKETLLRRHGNAYVTVWRPDDVLTLQTGRKFTLKKYIQDILDPDDNTREAIYIFDRDFFSRTNLREQVVLPEFITFTQNAYDVTMCLGGPRSGAAFHRQVDGWTGVVHGMTRWFLYPLQRTPPGGIWPGYSSQEWYDLVYSKLSEGDRPLECVLEAGEILYVPEGMYQSSVNLADTVTLNFHPRHALTEVQRLLHKASQHHRLMDTSILSESQKADLAKKTMQIFQQLMKMLPDSADVQVWLGEAAWRGGDLAGAERHTRHATRIDPFFVVAYLKLAQIHHELGNIGEAERNYQAAAKLNPGYLDVYVKYSDFLLTHGRTQEAIDMLSKALEQQPSNIDFVRRLKVALVKLGDMEGAQKVNLRIRQLELTAG